MFNYGIIRVYHTNVEPLSSGTRVFTDGDNIVDIEELHRQLANGNIVMLVNDVSEHSSATKKQYYMVSDELTAEEGYSDTFAFTHYGRSLASVTNRKLVLSFAEKSNGWEMKASYFDN